MTQNITEISSKFTYSGLNKIMKKVYRSTIEIESKKYNEVDSHAMFEYFSDPVEVCEDGPIIFYYMDHIGIIIFHSVSNIITETVMYDNDAITDAFDDFCKNDKKYFYSYDGGEEYILIQYDDKGFTISNFGTLELNGIEAKDEYNGFVYEAINDISNGDVVFLSVSDSYDKEFTIMSDKTCSIIMKPKNYKSKLQYLYNAKPYKNFIKRYLFGLK